MDEQKDRAIVVLGADALRHLSAPINEKNRLRFANGSKGPAKTLLDSVCCASRRPDIYKVIIPEIFFLQALDSLSDIHEARSLGSAVAAVEAIKDLYSKIGKLDFNGRNIDKGDEKKVFLMYAGRGQLCQRHISIKKLFRGLIEGKIDSREFVMGVRDVKKRPQDPLAAENAVRYNLTNYFGLSGPVFYVSDSEEGRNMFISYETNQEEPIGCLNLKVFLRCILTDRAVNLLGLRAYSVSSALRDIGAAYPSSGLGEFTGQMHIDQAGEAGGASKRFEQVTKVLNQDQVRMRQGMRFLGSRCSHTSTKEWKQRSRSDDRGELEPEIVEKGWSRV